MKINFDEISASTEFHAFAEAHDLTLRLWKLDNGKCAAKFERFESAERGLLISHIGVGDSWNDAVTDYARQISGRYAVRGDIRFPVPRLIVGGDTERLIFEYVRKRETREAA